MFLIAIMLAFFYFICSVFINIAWINDIACSFGYFLAIYLVLFVALIPGFYFIFTLISLLWKKKDKRLCLCKEEDVTVLIQFIMQKNGLKK